MSPTVKSTKVGLQGCITQLIEKHAVTKKR